MPSKVALFFVASPLQVLAASRIAKTFEADARQILVWYQPSLAALVQPDAWDATCYLPWPRFEPLPGWFGRHRRLLENIHKIAALIGQCDELVIHSAVFDTEAINYFLRALPRLCGVSTAHARILPDGIISIRRYPLSVVKRAAQRLRKLRRLAAPRLLDYWCFSGDRIGSDAPFCDRVYVVAGLPHEYPPSKVCVLPALVEAVAPGVESGRRALLIGQPLVEAGLMSQAGRDCVAASIDTWLRAQALDGVDYKRHPKDGVGELCRADYRVIDVDEPLEVFMSHTAYSVVIGVRSSALLFARQIYPPTTRVVAVGWEHVRFKSEQEKDQMTRVFLSVGVELLAT